MNLTVIIPTHNPDLNRLRRTFKALATQTLPAVDWEIVVVDNASTPQVDLAAFPNAAPADARIVRERQLGLTTARRHGFSEARGDLLVLVDDDNVLASDYLACALRLAAAHPRVGAFGGRSVPEFEIEPPSWAPEFFPLLALRDLGDTPRISAGLRPPSAARNAYPSNSAPIGAGMVIRREAARHWLAATSAGSMSDRCGDNLTSGGDNDIVLTIMEHGWDVAYWPELSLTHLIPASRLEPDYLARLNRGIQQSWMQVLTKHHASPWPSIAPWTVPLRQLKAWFTHRAWSSPAAQIRWQGACGHFEGRAFAQPSS